MLTILNPLDDDQKFPDTNTALEEPDGLLAVGGCLSPQRLEKAYRHGIFPWYSENQPILWWSPNPRMILRPESFRVSKSMRKVVRKDEFQVSFDSRFREVMENCANSRGDTSGTWITSEMKEAYLKMFECGCAHSVETWYREELVGGLYGIAIGRVFFGESMFHRRSNASKIALTKLIDMLKIWGYALIDCQVKTQHLLSLGAEEIPRTDFVRLLNKYCDLPPCHSAWSTAKPASFGGVLKR